MIFKVFLIKTDADGKNATDIERILNEFEAELDTKDMQINNMLTTSPKSIGDNILLIIQYGPKPKEEITENL
ncbi:MAG: hypothetical protein M3297_14975 [Thermoproteota archaeon]|nr:hypothetical protein [Thermoproteota archaeon]